MLTEKGCRVRCDVNALERAWFDAAGRDSERSEELAVALAEKPPADFRRLKVGLGCMLAALLVLALPMLKPSPKLVEPVAPVAVQKASLPSAPVVRAVQAVKKPAKPAPAKKTVKRASGKLVARK